MQVLRARSAGFCLGVSLALRRLDRELGKFLQAGQRQDAEWVPGSRLITLGPIIHNPLVMRYYTDKGVICESDPEHLTPSDTVVIRAHGIPRPLENHLNAVGVRLIDATCPKVKKAQLAIGKEYARGGVLLLFGENEHPEVRGLLSYAENNSLVFGDLDDLEKLPLNPDNPYFLAAQTTQERAAFKEARKRLEERLQRKIRCLDTICDATSDRQQGVHELADRVEAMVVVGGLNSGNTRRLAEVARAKGVPTIHVEQVRDISHDFEQNVLLRAKTVGLTAGASTPEEHINAMQTHLENLCPDK